MNNFKKNDVIIHTHPYNRDHFRFFVKERLGKKDGYYHYILIRLIDNKEIESALYDAYELDVNYIKKKQFETEMKEIINE